MPINIDRGLVKAAGTTLATELTTLDNTQEWPNGAKIGPGPLDKNGLLGLCAQLNLNGGGSRDEKCARIKAHYQEKAPPTHDLSFSKCVARKASGERTACAKPRYFMGFCKNHVLDGERRFGELPVGEEPTSHLHLRTSHFDRHDSKCGSDREVCTPHGTANEGVQ